MAAVQQENMYQQQYTIPVVPHASLETGVSMDMSPSGPVISDSTSAETIPIVEKRFGGLKAENGTDTTPQNISAKLKERYCGCICLTYIVLCIKFLIF